MQNTARSGEKFIEVWFGPSTRNIGNVGLGADVAVAADEVAADHVEDRGVGTGDIDGVVGGVADRETIELDQAVVDVGVSDGKRVKATLQGQIFKDQAREAEAPGIAGRAAVEQHDCLIRGPDPSAPGSAHAVGRQDRRRDFDVAAQLQGGKQP